MDFDVAFDVDSATKTPESAQTLIEQLKEFQMKAPELVLTWNDDETDAKGWLVINSLRGGAAGGGTRMKAGINYQEILLLAKTMEIKFAASGPAIGGAKSGIDFDPADPQKQAVLKRWYKAILPMLKNCYGTGGDLNVDYVREVIPLTEEVGLVHPQEGILQGHFGGIDKTEKAKRLTQGTRKIVTDSRFVPDQAGTYTIADLVSGYSVAEAVIHYYRTIGEDPRGKRAIIQGWGLVGSAAGYYLTNAGLKVVGIFDILGGVINMKGFSLADVRRFLREKNNHKFTGYTLNSIDEMSEMFWRIPADVFIPAASSGLVTLDQVDSMIEAGVRLIACGANMPFADEGNFYGPTAEHADNKISVIPDFIANCGIARVFAYLMQDDATASEESIFDDVSNRVQRTLSEACFTSAGNMAKITRSSYQNALKRIN